jgi:hypothetical protein
MPLASRLVSAGIPSTAATAILGTVATGLTAAGTTQATALQLGSDINVCSTVAASTGVILQAMNPGDEVIVRNGGANALLVYPPVGGTINALSANAGYSVATATPNATIRCLTATTFLAFQAA